VTQAAGRTAKSSSATTSRARAPRAQIARAFSSPNPLMGLQRKAGNRAVGSLFSTAVPTREGKPLSIKVRQKMESRFGKDFRGVRIHEGPSAAEMAQRMEARAYTVGRDIVFDRGEYAPELDSGGRLLAHELAHVVQQSRTSGTRSGAAETPALEASAEKAASATAAPVAVAGSAPAGVARAPKKKPPSPLEFPSRGIEMPWVGKGPGVNSSELGYLRDSGKFWQEYAAQYGKDLSRANLKRAQGGRAPKVDKQWIKVNPQHASYKGQPLIHHHVGQGSKAVPIPEQLHHAHSALHTSARQELGPGDAVQGFQKRPDYIKQDVEPHAGKRIKGKGIKQGKAPKIGKVPPNSPLAGVPPSELRPVDATTGKIVGQKPGMPSKKQIGQNRAAAQHTESMKPGYKRSLGNKPRIQNFDIPEAATPQAPGTSKYAGKSSKSPRRAPKKTSGAGIKAKPAAPQKTPAKAASAKGPGKAGVPQPPGKSGAAPARKPARTGTKQASQASAPEPAHGPVPPAATPERPAPKPASEGPKAEPTPKAQTEKSASKANASPKSEEPGAAPAPEGGETATKAKTKKTTKKATQTAASEKAAGAKTKQVESGEPTAGETTRPKRATAKPAPDAPAVEPKAPEVHPAAPESHAPAPPAPSESARVTARPDHASTAPAGEHALETAPGAKPKVQPKPPGGEPRVSEPAVAHPAPTVKPTPTPAKTNVQAPPGKVEATGTPHVTGEGQGFHPAGEPGVHVNTPGGSKLGKLKAFGAQHAGTAMNVAGTGMGLYQDLKDGQKPGEAISGAVGNFAANHLYSGGPVDTAINLTNTALQLAGAPKAVTDTTQIAADVTPSSFLSSMMKQDARAAYNIATGDMKGLDKQVQEMEAGKAGGPLQGWAMMADLGGRLAGGEDPEHALNEVAKLGKGSTLEKAGNYLGDEAYQFINKDLPEASEFAKKDIARLKESSKEKLSKAWHWVAD